MKIVARNPAEQNRAVLDPWSVVHYAAGLAAGLARIPREVSIPAAVAWELAEQYIERTEWGRDVLETRRPESVANAVADVAIFLVGEWCGRRWHKRG